MDSKDISFTQWLHYKGVREITESNKEFNASIHDSGSLFVFDREEDARQLVKLIKAVDNIEATDNDDLSHYYASKSSIVESHGIKKRGDSIIMYVSTEVRDKLAAAYMREVKPDISEEERKAQSEAAVAALDKIDGLSSHGQNRQDENRKRQYDGLGKMAQMLRNKTEAWNGAESLYVLSTALSIYLADNYILLSDAERNRIQKTIALYSGETPNGEIVAGLYTDEAFRGKLTLSVNKKSLIEQYAQSLLRGGVLGFDPKKFAIDQDYFNADKSKSYAYAQPRFFAGPNGEAPETNQIIFHAGGSNLHAAERILTRIEDPSKIGGAKYTYTKIDGGFNMEHVDRQLLYPIYTTEIIPKYKKVNGKFVLLSNEEANTKDLKEYQSYIEATIELLVSSEKKIQLYKKAADVAGPNAQGEDVSPSGSDEAKKWHELNDIIKSARGNEIPEAKFELPVQRVGNCSVFSATLTFAAIMGMDEKQGIVKRGGVDIGLDFLQQAKTYKHSNAIYRLSEIQRQNQDSNVAKEIMEAARKNEKYNGEDPIEYAIKNNILLKRMHPIEWAMVENTNINQGHKSGSKILINGETPFIYGIKSQDALRIHGKSFISYCIDYKLQPSQEMLDEVAASKQDITTFLATEYHRIYQSNPTDVALSSINNLYSASRAKQALVPLSQKSDFMRMLNSAVDIKEIAYEMQQMNIKAEDWMHLQKHCDMKTAYRIELIASEMNSILPKPYFEDDRVIKGIQDIPARLEEAKKVEVISKALKSDFDTYELAREYMDELNKNPSIKADAATKELVHKISDNYKDAKRRYDLLLTSGSSRRIETHTGFLESAYNVSQNEMPAKTKLTAEMKEALSKVKEISLQIESTKWSDKVKVAETNQREL